MISHFDIPSPSPVVNSTAAVFLAVGLVIVVSALVLFVMRNKKRK